MRKDTKLQGSKARPAKKSATHPGFKSAQRSIARRQGVSMKRAGAILAAGSRRAGPKARKANPRLHRVSGAK